MHRMDADKASGDKAWWQLHKNATNCIEHILEVTSNKTPAVRPSTTYLENHPN